MALKDKPRESAAPQTPETDSVSTGDIVKLTFNVPKSTRQHWKQAALHRHMTVTDLIVEAMEKHLS
ncbi:hypothetical protein [Comamonas antarctica]|uniref:Plasmid segregation centromere-binding protein ParG n=1 Tax=Comamonas antarctica TaxID=2743470 RepID=A0A6N1X812_9BURK|nr:hypothetical protein [Comamonas antarctica]QKV54443.1 hypothetical protein HUK68_16850 [Comamonas antarctica]